MSASFMNIEVTFPDMPLWKGVMPTPFIPPRYEFRMAWDERGVIRQTTPENVRRMVIQSYSSDDYAFPSTLPGASSWGDVRGNLAIERIRAMHGALRGLSVMEIGAGTTYIAERLTTVHGVKQYVIVDPSVKDLTHNPAITVHREYFSEAGCHPSDGEFDLVISLNCIEHVDDPVDFLRGVRRILERSNGRALLMFPDNEGQLARGDINVVLHEHTNYFSRRIVNNLAACCGLEMLECFSEYDLFYCYMGLGEICCPKAHTVDILLPESAAAFVRGMEYLDARLGALLAQNTKIAFHGACNGLNNALAFSRVLDKTALAKIQIFDGDERKCGQYMPFCPNPIRSAGDPGYRDMDFVFVSAMTFYDPIRKHLVEQVGLAPEKVVPYYPLASR